MSRTYLQNLSVLSTKRIGANSISGECAFGGNEQVLIYEPESKQCAEGVSKASPKQTLSSLCYSPDGRFLAVAYTASRSATVRVIDARTKANVASFPIKQTHGVACMSFSENGEYLTTIGAKHDGLAQVWAWRAAGAANGNTALAANKLGSDVHAVAFLCDDAHMISAGHRHLRVWSTANVVNRSGDGGGGGVGVLDGRSVNCGELRDETFVDVACGASDADTAFVITEQGTLCVVDVQTRQVTKWVKLKRAAHALALAEQHGVVACACHDGMVRLFDAESLQYKGAVPRAKTARANEAHPVALRFAELGRWLYVANSDRSVIVYDTSEPLKAKRSHSLLFKETAVQRAAANAENKVENRLVAAAPVSPLVAAAATPVPDNAQSTSVLATPGAKVRFNEDLPSWATAFMTPDATPASAAARRTMAADSGAVDGAWAQRALRSALRLAPTTPAPAPEPVAVAVGSAAPAGNASGADGAWAQRVPGSALRLAPTTPMVAPSSAASNLDASSSQSSARSPPQQQHTSTSLSTPPQNADARAAASDTNAKYPHTPDTQTALRTKTQTATTVITKETAIATLASRTAAPTTKPVRAPATASDAVASAAPAKETAVQRARAKIAAQSRLRTPLSQVKSRPSMPSAGSSVSSVSPDLVVPSVAASETPIDSKRVAASSSSPSTRSSVACDAVAVAKELESLARRAVSLHSMLKSSVIHEEEASRLLSTFDRVVDILDVEKKKGEMKRRQECLEEIQQVLNKYKN